MPARTHTDSSGDVIGYDFDAQHPEVLRAQQLGIPLERSERFIRRNQGDYGRLVGSVGGDEGGQLYPAVSAGGMRPQTAQSSTLGGMLGLGSAPMPQTMPGWSSPWSYYQMPQPAAPQSYGTSLAPRVSDWWR